MKRKWIFLAGVALSLGALTTAAASEENTPAHSQLAHLDLTDTQKEQLQALREQHRAALRALRDTIAVRHEQNRAAFRAAAMNILTAEQQAKLGPSDLDRELDVVVYGERIEAVGESMKNIRTALGRWWDQMNDPEYTERVYSKLNLTDEQKKTLRELAEKQRAARHRWTQRLHKAMDAILTDEQREKLKSIKDEAF